MRVKTALAVGLLVMAGVTGCGSGGDDSGVASANGGSSKPSSSSAAKADKKSDQEKALEYAKCMRENGIPDFQDPEVKDDGAQLMLPEGVDPQKGKEVSEKCKQYLPSGGEKKGVEDPKVTEQLKKLAECMRKNGVSNFPDPQAGGGGVVVDEDQTGMSPDDPKFKKAQKACAAHQPGGAMNLNPSQGGGPGGSKG
ncbi:hypothetical protein [Streptomyces sp. MZ04]|uniref:hypothetical protein n=1 Tax=Streptomyces sp. MZ04 TaxID=2559236 RepID=UPI00107EE458|nr:hypothetical protein [Streptomyces sp. MZ04]TGB05685.1 hypothetical protein E2651_24495 [Streptomyces sp. MZ04]